MGSWKFLSHSVLLSFVQYTHPLHPWTEYFTVFCPFNRRENYQSLFFFNLLFLKKLNHPNVLALEYYLGIKCVQNVLQRITKFPLFFIVIAPKAANLTVEKDAINKSKT